MKVKCLIFSAAVALTATAAVAQSVEYDDMYFNGKDRQKLKDQQAKEAAAFSQTPASKHNKSNAASEVYADNGSYSARNQNPEFAARSNAEAASDDAEYFSSDYRYNNAAQVQNFNKNYSNWYGSPWVANNYWGSSIYDWNTPYYGSMYDSWGNPWMNPYYRSGWSTSFSFAMGNSWNYGMGSGMGYGMGMGFGCPFGNPYNNSWASWGMSYGAGFGYGYGGGYYRYPTVIVVNDTRSYSYGKRGSQNGMVTSRQSAANTRARQTGVATDPNGNNVTRPIYNAGGRVATTPNVTSPSRGTVQRQDDYYNRNWRAVRQTGTYSGGSTYTQPTRSSQSGGWNNNSSQTQWQRSSGSDNGRSGYSSGSNSSGATRSAAPASSGTGGRTRGRD
jgi:hypothetical protein